MPIPLTHLQEELSLTYVSAVAAMAGARVNRQTGIEYGIDARINQVQRTPKGKFKDTGWLFECQLKATINAKIDSQHVTYKMDAEAYNKLATWEGITSMFLILLCLPKDDESWLEMDMDKLLVRAQCYWYHVTDPATENTSSKTIYIPTQNRFDTEAVKYLLREIKVGRFKNG